MIDRSSKTLALLLRKYATCSSSVKKRRLGVPDFFLASEFGLGAKDIAALGAPMRMAVEYFHNVLAAASPRELSRLSISRLIFDVCERPVKRSSTPRSTASTFSLTPSASLNLLARCPASSVLGTLASTVSTEDRHFFAAGSHRAPERRHTPRWTGILAK